MPPKKKSKVDTKPAAGASQAPTGKPTRSLTGKLFCNCVESLITTGKEVHSPGRAAPLETTIDTTFLSFAIPGLKTHVEHHNLPLTSTAALLWLQTKANFDHIAAENLEKARKKAQDAEERKRAIADQKRLVLEAKKHAKELAQNRVAFLTVGPYGTSVEQRQAIGQWPPHHLFGYNQKVSTVPELLGTTATASVSQAEVKREPLNQQGGAASVRSLFEAARNPSPYITAPSPAESTSRSASPEAVNNMSAQPTIDTTGGVEPAIKDAIQELFVLQQHISGFRAENQDRLNQQMEEIARSLGHLEEINSKPENPLKEVLIAPEIIEYVDDGRNPDIFTRDFVELVQRGNSVINGKQKAFKDFSKVLAKEFKDNLDGMDDEIDMIMGDAGMEWKDGRFVEKELQNGHAAQ